MNPPAFAPSLTKCRCQHCSAGIEFDRNNFQPGLTVSCPHCGMETALYLVQASAPVAPRSSERISKVQEKAAEARPKTFYATGLRIMGILFFVAGLLLMLDGCSKDDSAKSALQQSPAYVEACAGMLLCATSTLIYGVAGVIEAIRNK